MLEKVKSLEAELKTEIIGDQLTQFMPITNNTQVEDICGNLDHYKIDTTILSNDKMKNDLVSLCKLSGKHLKLLYRASRDGFQASAFHAKCDNLPKTLTIIKAVNGYIFGGYASVAWDSTSGFKSDPNAFLFSLVNVHSSPRLIPVNVGDKHSVYCDFSYGPSFGSHALSISSNSNLTCSSYSKLNDSYNFTSPIYGYNQLYLLAGSYQFYTCEIEVFELN